MAAIVGCAGLEPVMAAVEAGKTVALANKEALVTAGALMIEAAARSGATILPVDSEHNAIFQCLAGSRLEDVARIILTASGGPFRTRSLADMEAMSPAEAVAHPNWSMGAKISVDFGDDDEQGARADRGAPSVRAAVGADRHPRPPAVGDPFDGRICRRLDHRPARQPRHAHPDRAHACAIPRVSPRRRRRSTSRGSASSSSKHLIRHAFRRCASPARRSKPGAAKRSCSMPPTRSRWRHFSPAGSASSILFRLWSAAIAQTAAPAPRSIADVLDIDRAARDSVGQMIQSIPA